MEIHSNAADPATYQADRIGFYVSIATAVLTIITFGIGILTPPMSGANCTGSCFEYPYLDIGSRFPRDYYWMFPAMVLNVLVVVLAVCIYQYAAPEKKIFGLLGLCFMLMAALILIVNYFLQTSVIPASLDSGETEGITILTQFNPHGIFIALEEIGYLLMSLAFLCLAPVFSGANRVERAVRWIFRLSFPLALTILLAISISYGVDRQDRFEIVALSINWLALIIGGFLLSVVFRRAVQHSPDRA
jgi:hypothetical protein